MSKNKGKIVDTNQTSLFDLLNIQDPPRTPGSFDVDIQLKEQASYALRKCPYSRYEVAAKMSEMLGREVTKSMLDNRTAESKEDQQWPAAWLAPFALVTSHFEQIKTINKLARLPIADSEKLLEMEIERKRQALESEEKELQDLLKLKAFINGKNRR